MQLIFLPLSCNFTPCLCKSLVKKTSFLPLDAGDTEVASSNCGTVGKSHGSGQELFQHLWRWLVPSPGFFLHQGSFFLVLAAPWDWAPCLAGFSSGDINGVCRGPHSFLGSSCSGSCLQEAVLGMPQAMLRAGGKQLCIHGLHEGKVTSSFDLD